MVGSNEEPTLLAGCAWGDRGGLGRDEVLRDHYSVGYGISI